MTPAQALSAKLRARKRHVLTRKWASWPADPRAQAWDEGYRVGVDCGSGIGFAREGFSTDNPYRSAR